ncbi:MAG: metallophosphoesterase [Gemmataceae bacterium]
MAERISPATLLRRAAALFDAPANRLAQSARRAWRGGFASGGCWMRLALEHLRGQPLAGAASELNRLGLIKYGLACTAALAWLLLTIRCQWPWLALLSVLAFYAVEAQMVFLFPLALDGCVRPFREARRWTRRAGGTLRVMRIVLPLAATMLFGGFLGRGFVRSWCLGCLAVCLWYEELRRLAEPDSMPFVGRFSQTVLFSCPILEERMPPILPLPPRCRGFEFGAFRLPGVRHERIVWHLRQSIRLLYASDLHLGHWWTAHVAEHLLTLARQTCPDLILLGGDLVDGAEALALMRSLLRDLTEVAPVHAIAGNHDHRAGLAAVADTVRAAGARWLPDHPIEHPVRIEAVLAPPDPPGSLATSILCAHAPAVFPAAVAAGYRLVLAGHLHGGQCVLATHRGKQYPAVWFHRWHGLRFRQGGTEMLVSRGMADSFPFRFNCPREVLLCEIV